MENTKEKIRKLYEKYGISGEENPAEMFCDQKFVAKPFVFTVTNDGEDEQEAVFYGLNIFGKEPNFGSGKDIKITPANEVLYEKHLTDTLEKPFEFIAFRISCNKNLFIRKGEMKIVYLDVNARRYKDVISLAGYWNTFQCIGDCVDLNYRIKIDANSYFTIKVPPKTTFNFVIYPSKIAIPQEKTT